MVSSIRNGDSQNILIYDQMILVHMCDNGHFRRGSSYMDTEIWRNWHSCLAFLCLGYIFDICWVHGRSQDFFSGGGNTFSKKISKNFKKILKNFLKKFPKNALFL